MIFCTTTIEDRSIPILNALFREVLGKAVLKSNTMANRGWGSVGRLLVILLLLALAHFNSIVLINLVRILRELLGDREGQEVCINRVVANLAGEGALEALNEPESKDLRWILAVGFGMLTTMNQLKKELKELSSIWKVESGEYEEAGERVPCWPLLANCSLAAPMTDLNMAGFTEHGGS